MVARRGSPLKHREVQMPLDPGDDRVEEVPQHLTDVLVAKQIAIAHLVPRGADRLEPRQQSCDHLEILEAP